MIHQLQLIRNIGRFDSFASGNADSRLQPLTLIYAENGRGKTTLAGILRSLATGDAIPILERRRLAAAHQPHVIVGCDSGTKAMFLNGVWDRNLPDMVVFDDVFIDQNVYSGLVVGTEHRQNLHELILGAQGIELSRQLQELIAKVEEHNRSLRQIQGDLPSELGGMSVDRFCDLEANPQVDQQIEVAERSLAAAREQDPVRITPGFGMLSIPAFDMATIEQVLRADIPDLDSTAAARVHEHLATVGKDAEVWIGEGMRIQTEGARHDAGKCIFCAQDLSGSPVIAHYRAFFSEAYRQLLNNIDSTSAELKQIHGNNTGASLERAVRILGERKQFWSRFVEMPDFSIDTDAIICAWQAVYNELQILLAQKQASPLDPITLPERVRTLVQAHEANIAVIGGLNQQLIQANERIAVVKEQTANANPAAIAAVLSTLKAVRSRYSETVAPICDAYLAEKQAKAATEQMRTQARTALEQYRVNVFPNYQAAINRYLARFNAGFHLDSVAAANTRAGSTCTYNVVINNTAVAVGGGNPRPGEHSFRNILSAGDRSALALGFFFASIELDPNSANKIAVIDDPISSLDDHRSLTTVQEIRRLSTQVSQVLVLSHSKSFLCRIWEGADRDTSAALQVVRTGNASTIQSWNVDQDSITEHDRRHAALCDYLANGGANEREIAHSLRPHIEAFFRVACPENFPPGTLLGPFRGICEQRVNTPQQILGARDIQELRDLVEYGNRFHHDTNAAWETEVVNADELTGFVKRVLAFVKRP